MNKSREMPNKTYNILVVEDEWINANFICQILETLSHNVVDTVSCAKEALQSVKNQEIDFILMDINIDGAIDGITLAHAINLEKKIPIIYMSAFGNSSTIEEASHTNMYGFLIKPFGEQEVEAVLNSAIARVLSEKEADTPKEKSLLELGSDYLYDLEKNSLLLNDKTILLSKNESKLLYLFCLNLGEALSHERIKLEIWGEKEISESTIRDTIVRLRKKIDPLKLENIPKVGYILQKK